MADQAAKRPVLAQRPTNWDQMTREEKLAWAAKVLELIKRG